MTFEEIEECFYDVFKLQSFLYKLQQCGENSEEMIYISKLIERFKINKPPRGITQTTLLRNTFQFSDSEECFQNFALVCKSWHTAVETTKFRNQSPPNYVLKYNPPSPSRLTKILSAFDCLELNSYSLGHKWITRMLDHVLSDTKYLKKIKLVYYSDPNEYEFDPNTNPGNIFPIVKDYFLKLVKKHKDTLKILHSPFFTLPAENILNFQQLQIYSTDLIDSLEDTQNTDFFWKPVLLKFLHTIFKQFKISILSIFKRIN
jgi:hypothetical protein